MRPIVTLSLLVVAVMAVVALASGQRDGTDASRPDPLLAAEPAAAQDTTTQPSEPAPAGSQGTTTEPSEPAPGPSEEQQQGGTPPLPEPLRFGGAMMSIWGQEDIKAIQRSDRNTIPLMIPPDEVLDPDYYLWDGWPVRQWDGSVAKIGPYVVYISLSAPRTTESKQPFFARSKWRYWLNKGDGWTYGGEVFPDQALGSRQWAGSARYDPQTQKISFFYTAVGKVEGAEGSASYPNDLPKKHPAAGRPPVLQYIARTTAEVDVTDDGVEFSGFGPHEVILEPDGELYQTFAQYDTADVIYGFRDPWAFRDPSSGEKFLLFTANTSLFGGDGPYNGVVGVGHQRDDGSWELLPPIVGSPRNAQLERPHLVWQDDRIYLYWTTHDFVFQNEGAGPEGLYGMVTDSDSFRGHYVPLNGSGFVAGNPKSVPVQTYSYLVLPGGGVMSYLNQAGDPKSDGFVGSWVGTPAPLFHLTMEGDRAFVTGALTPVGRDLYADDQQGQPASPQQDASGPPSPGGGAGSPPGP